jgi:hypothetical protein
MTFRQSCNICREFMNFGILVRFALHFLVVHTHVERAADKRGHKTS